MNKTVFYILLAMLILSLGGGGYLLYTNFQKDAAINQLTGDLGNTKDELSKTTSKLDESNKALADKTDELEKMQNNLNDTKDQAYQLSRDKLQLQNDIQKFMCPLTIPDGEVNNVSTNQALIEPITKAAERNYHMTSIGTTFKAIWNNSKTANFTITNRDRTTVVVVVSWDFNESMVNGIYDINSFCYYYIR